MIDFDKINKMAEEKPVKTVPVENIILDNTIDTETFEIKESLPKVDQEYTDTEKLKQSFKYLRNDKPSFGEFDKPLREADFCHEICGSFYAEFTEDYVDRLKRLLGGAISIYVSSSKITTISSTHFGGNYYFNMEEVDYILEEIEYYVKTGNWRQPE